MEGGEIVHTTESTGIRIFSGWEDVTNRVL